MRQYPISEFTQQQRIATNLITHGGIVGEVLEELMEDNNRPDSGAESADELRRVPA
jgi:hypothetical protein